ncbi:unnamed protein product, partial [Polarella glacialis]
MGLPKALEQRAMLIEQLSSILRRSPCIVFVWDARHRLPVRFSSIFISEMADAEGLRELYEKPNSDRWASFAAAAFSLEEWLSHFPEDMSAQLWAHRVALARADFTQLNSTIARIYGYAHSSARHICSV